MKICDFIPAESKKIPATKFVFPPAIRILDEGVYFVLVFLILMVFCFLIGNSYICGADQMNVLKR